MMKQPAVFSPESASQLYLTSLRGILVVSSFFWIFCQTFVPGIVSDVPAPAYQVLLRKICGPILWNESLIHSAFIILSARTLCVPFLADPTATTYAGCLIRRPLRMGVALSAASLVASVIFTYIGTAHITTLQNALPNPAISPPQTFPNQPLRIFNSIYNILWVVRDFTKQAANRTFPSNTLWVPSLIYSQSYTVYITMVILPFVRPQWHFQGLLVFALGSYWMNSWGWYSVTGLLLADVSLNPTLNGLLKANINFTPFLTIPSWTIYMLSAITGLTLKYLWATVAPHLLNAELTLHPTLHLSDNVSVATYDLSEPYARLDNYLLFVGLLLLIERFSRLQSLLSSARWLAFLGDRSLSLFTTQAILVYTVGIKLFLHLHTTKQWSVAAANAVTLLVCVLSVLVVGEAFHRVVDLPGRGLARWFSVWVME